MKKKTLEQVAARVRAFEQELEARQSLLFAMEDIRASALERRERAEHSARRAKHENA